MGRLGQRLLRAAVLFALLLPLVTVGGAGQLRGAAAVVAPADPDRPCTRPSTAAITLDRPVSAAPVGTTHVVRGRVTGVAGGTVTLRVVDGPNEGRELRAARSGEGFRGGYSSERPGTDVVEAALTVDGRVLDRARARHTWLPEDVPPPPDLRLTQGSAASEVGTRHTVSVSGVPRGGDLAVRVLDGPHAGRALQVAGSGSTRTASYVGQEQGTDRIGAVVTVGDEQFSSAPVAHLWRPKPVVRVSPARAELTLGERHTVRIEVVGGNGSGTLSAAVASGPHAGADLGLSRSGTTAVGSYAGAHEGTDRIVATLRRDGLPAIGSSPAVVVWSPPPVTIALGPTGTRSELGTRHVLTVDVSGTSAAPVLRVVDGPNAGTVVPLAGVGGGTYRGSYGSMATGTDVLRAEVSGVRSGTVTHEWVAPAPVVTIRPSDGTSEAGDRVSLTVTVANSGATPAVSVVAGPNAGVPVSVRGSGGRFTAVYSSNGKEGTDRISATVPGASDTAARTWRERSKPPSITVSPRHGTSQLGATLGLMITVTNSDETPRVQITGPNARARVSIDPMGGGRFAAAYTSNQEEGTDTITVSVPGASDTATHTWAFLEGPGTPDVRSPEAPPDIIGLPGRLHTNGGTTAVLLAAAVGPRAAAPAPDGEGCLTVVLAPRGTTTPVGSRVALTATVLDDRQRPVGGARVAFRAAQRGSETVTRTVRAGPSGVATFRHTRTAPGPEEITAEATATLGTGRASTTHSWIPVEGLTVRVEPPGAVSPVGSPFTATVVVRSPDGDPVPGADVRLQVTAEPAGPPQDPSTDLEVPVETASSPQGDAAVEPDGALGDLATAAEPAEQVTDAQGTASFTWTSPAARTETMTATATAGALDGEGSASHVWADTTGLGVVLQPAGATSHVDSEFTATALVTVDGEPQGDAEVEFSADLAAVDGSETAALTETVPTDGSGLASFDYRRDVAGDEVVSVVVSVGGEQSGTAMAHFWVDVPGLVVDLTPAGEASRVGADFTATTTVSDDGEPLPGATVLLTRSLGDDHVEEQPVLTGPDGTVELTWSRDDLGLEAAGVQVTTLDGRTGWDSVAHLWTDPDASSEAPALQVTSGLPAGPVAVQGNGCPPGADVELTWAGQPWGSTRADGAGAYRTMLSAVDDAVGRYTVAASCPPVAASAPVDLVVATSESGTAAAAGATVVAVFTFFVLFGGQLIRMSTVSAGAG